MALPELLAGVPLPGVDPEAVRVASARIRNRCGWHIAPQITETVVIDSRHTGVFFLPSLRVTAVSAAVNSGAARVTWTPTGRVELTDFHRGVGDLPLVVTFTHGYESCPPDIRATIAQMARDGLVPAAQVRTLTKGPFVESYFEQADPLDDVDGYRLPVML